MSTDACTNGVERVWSLADLELLHEIAKPSVVVVSEVQSCPTRYMPARLLVLSATTHNGVMTMQSRRLEGRFRGAFCQSGRST